MKKLLAEIKNYSPYNEQEEQDKQLFLTCINESNIFLRENLSHHFTASCWVTNPSHTKILLIYHKIYDSWSWMGGHADGCEDLLQVAIKELAEESGLSNFHLVSNDIFSLETLTVDGHIKKGHYVNSHLHFNVTYLFEASENETLIQNKEETNGIKWINIDEINQYVSEKWMMNVIYSKLIQKLNGEKR